MSKDDGEFSRTMRQMGVQPLKGGKSLRPPAPAPSTGRPEGQAAPQGGLPPSQPPTPAPAASKGAPDLDSAGRRIAALEEALAETREALEAARTEAEHLASLAASSGPEEGGLRALMQDRGLRGQEESRRAVLALLHARRWEGVESFFVVERPRAAREALGLGLFLHCGQEACPAPLTCAVVQVPPRRCEVCGGGTVAWDALNDALLLRGIREFVVLGGHPHVQGLLREQVDRRVDLRALPSHAPVPGERPGTLAEARFMVRWAQKPVDDEALPRCADPALAGLVDFSIHALAQR